MENLPNPAKGLPYTDTQGRRVIDVLICGCNATVEMWYYNWVTWMADASRAQVAQEMARGSLGLPNKASSDYWRKAGDSVWYGEPIR